LTAGLLLGLGNAQPDFGERSLPPFQVGSHERDRQGYQRDHSRHSARHHDPCFPACYRLGPLHAIPNEGEQSGDESNYPMDPSGQCPKTTGGEIDGWHDAGVRSRH